MERGEKDAGSFQTGARGSSGKSPRPSTVATFNSHGLHHIKASAISIQQSAAQAGFVAVGPER
jgi:hypothetical protein